MINSLTDFIINHPVTVIFNAGIIGAIIILLLNFGVIKILARPFADLKIWFRKMRNKPAIDKKLKDLQGKG